MLQLFIFPIKFKDVFSDNSKYLSNNRITEVWHFFLLNALWETIAFLRTDWILSVIFQLYFFWRKFRDHSRAEEHCQPVDAKKSGQVISRIQFIIRKQIRGKSNRRSNFILSWRFYVFCFGPFLTTATSTVWFSIGFSFYVFGQMSFPSLQLAHELRPCYYSLLNYFFLTELSIFFSFFIRNFCFVRFIGPILSKKFYSKRVQSGTIQAFFISFFECFYWKWDKSKHCSSSFMGKSVHTSLTRWLIVFRSRHLLAQS